MNRCLSFRSLSIAALAVSIAVGGAVTADAGLATAQYTAAVNPTTATAGSGSFTVTLTDCGVVAGLVACSGTSPAFAAMDSATLQLAFPLGSDQRSAAPVVATGTPGGKAWTAAYSDDGARIVLHATTTSNDLTFGDTVSLTLPVPTKVGADTITTSAADAAGNAFTRDGADPVLTVRPAAVNSLRFVQQPTETAAGALINPAPSVLATDAYGNPVPGTSVGMAVGANSAGGALNGTLKQITDVAGVAQFGDLSITRSGFGYVLLASSGNVSTQSAPFTVSTSTTVCQTYPCTGTGTDSAGTTRSTVTLTGPTTPSVLNLTLYNTTANPPPAICGAGTQGSGTRVDVAGANTVPNKAITLRFNKALVNAVPDNGVAHYNVCLGAVNTANPSQTWVTRSGGSAVFDAATQKYWGILPDCTQVSPASQPCLQSKNKDQAGDVLLQFSVPTPWDEQFVGNLPLGTTTAV